ncbi:MAG: 5'/3'-nucleotidase SurE [Candidatus Eisenbacteria bacterium]|uniref:5'-nucleotidase SurE n=1 Tax=Eiseniibacteriota bacterium TaxID=2212470 RepID=A0A538TN11_UNCEI|nr:MAG: 5'/3'-nucleotidase SurE [Candidatus Eisenbacteria bacterium]
MDILVTNDDGIQADGIRALAEALAPLGTISIIAPDREQSATSHALTLHRPLRVRKIGDGVMSVDGTPTDAVLLGVHGFLKRKPALVVSGINHGPNMGNDVLYSGTVAAASEGMFLGIPSIAISLATWEPTADFGPGARVAHRLVKGLLRRGLHEGSCLNINIPAIPWSDIKGVRVTRLGMRVYRDVIVEKTDPRGKLYYWIGGEEPTWKHDEASDFTAVEQGYVSITPLSFELTDYKAIVDLESLGLSLDESEA